MRYPVVFFDLDGTLTDSTEGITKSVQYALAKFGIESDLEKLRGFVGPPLHHSFASQYGFDEDKAMQAVTYYREYFTDRGLYENRVIEGVPALLGALSGGGATLLIVTSKPRVFAERIVAHFDLGTHFQHVVGSELDLSNTDKPTLVRLALERLPAGQPGPVVMVGDREHDIIGATANGVDSVGVVFGAGSRDELEKANATHVVDTVAELHTLLLG
ncbi:MAG: HAD hydrolase-like protein [bacterium]|nr:HAD hydrolase-like protein [bacterium]